ncbi:MAG TPA: hypothetical protein ENK41_01410 [Rhodobacteraceae bacterium]|nr:hypothetical protein [Paracoccaceae bacterium]
MLAVSLVLAAGSALAQAGLFDLTGAWRGNGTIRAEAGEPAREGRCRLSAIPLDPGRELRLRGRCATDKGSAEISIRFVLLDGGAVAAGIASSALTETVQFSGQLRGSAVRLRSRAPVSLGEMRGISLLSIEVTGEGRFSLTQSLVPEDGGAEIPLVEMAFQR